MSRSPHTAILMAFLLPIATGVLAPLPSSATSTPSGPSTSARRVTTSVSGWSTAAVSVESGRTASFRLRVSGPPRPVLLQRRTPQGWRAVDVGRTSPADRVVLAWRPPARVASYAVRVRVPATATHAAATTAARTLRVTAATTEPDPHSATEREVLRLVNEARATPRTCGSTSFGAVPPLALEPRLGRAAGKWAARMAAEEFFSHVGPDGSTPPQRIEAEGYRWRAWGENIAAGYATPAAAVQGWLASPAHCSNIMADHLAETGIGYVHDPDSPSVHYWVQKFASPQ